MRDRINPMFMTLNVSFCVSKEQDTTSKKCMHCYALDGSYSSPDDMYTTKATTL